MVELSTLARCVFGIITNLAMMLSCSIDIATGSTVIVTRTLHFFLLTADTRVTFEEGKPPQHACKIHRVGQTFFAVTGMAKASPGWDAYGTATAASGSGGGVRQIGSAFERIAKPRLVAAVERMRVDAPKLFAKHVRGEGVVFSVAFVAIERGTPTLELVEFRYRAGGSLDVTRESCPGGGCIGVGAESYFLGQSDAIMKHRAATPPPDLTLDTITDYFVSLVELEIKAHPEDVGGPIDVVRINLNGTAQSLRRGHCRFP
jgi:hypothetical protein